VIAGLAYRFLRHTRPRAAWRFLTHCGWGMSRAMSRFTADRRRGITFPPFLFLSITNACQLKCTGCWVSVATPAEGPEHLDIELIHKVLRAARERGNRFFGILGGEPLLHPRLLDIFDQHRDCYFQLFTNGHGFTPDIAAQLAAFGNVTPLFSIEGGETTSDQRRGRLNVFSNTLRGLHNAVQAGLITGVATSLCQSNLESQLTEAWLDELIRLRVMYVWYYAYRPVGPLPGPDLALTAEQMLHVRRFILQMRPRKPLAIVDAYWDADGRAVCPMAMGVSHHINPWGDIEPCPVLQMAADNIRDGDLAQVLTQSPFLQAMRTDSAQATRGCILLEQPQTVLALAAAHGARDTAHRRPGLFAELQALHPCVSHASTGTILPETHWAYRWAKKRWFFGFGAYG
jgi:MoaA/NifB/PqqE/SkfB family radical SAM enzyme